MQEMKWLDVKHPVCILCGSRGANVFLEIHLDRDESHICFSCCAEIRTLVEERTKNR
jgi:hypothetical protein